MVKHAESVVLPLLLPDSPVAIWWPTRRPPTRPATRSAAGPAPDHRLGGVSRGKATAMLTQCENYAPGNTDLSWTRLTRGAPARRRARPAPAQDHACPRHAEKISPSRRPARRVAVRRLKVEVTRGSSGRSGITEVSMETKQGEIRIARADGRLATFTSPHRPDRPVALKRRARSRAARRGAATPRRGRHLRCRRRPPGQAEELEE